ncbi:acyl-CoA thioesterase [Flammeovirga kamogawensis]|uniref:Acyl-CoA thioesterase n=1 Tax=Flammeovirga kamogawensis TaxID=373891 RepID=A0ABX8GVH0_9BACT|nr:acyl-CoA thioesterase [Flammeovirga kamogawensis]MBB6461557.1 acyl-CoA thioester hydrolase [Flammeovirga kamogawensis]QWG07511.1 acyl-CoA thioesterase [Flammeovirga kamogawensis]TRX69324.1 acyl-CoA thioesterase [Flammeovirga kamogawensis]
MPFYHDKQKSYPQETESRVIIRFQDCDPFRHLNNAKYFDYFFNAREDRVPQLYGYNIADIFKEYGTGWVIYNHQISYLRPAAVGEWVRIKSSIIHVDANTIVVEYYMLDDAKKELKTVLWSTMKYINPKNGKSTDHQPEVFDYLDTIKNKEVNFAETSFDDRIKAIKEKRHS